MKSTGYFDIKGKEIFVGMKCRDVINNVDDIEIVEDTVDGYFYAEPTGLDAELLENVVDNLEIIEQKI